MLPVIAIPVADHQPVVKHEGGEFDFDAHQLSPPGVGVARPVCVDTYRRGLRGYPIRLEERDPARLVEQYARTVREWLQTLTTRMPNVCA